MIPSASLILIIRTAPYQLDLVRAPWVIGLIYFSSAPNYNYNKQTINCNFDKTLQHYVHLKLFATNRL